MIDAKGFLDALGQLSPAALTIVALYLIMRSQRETEKNRAEREKENDKIRADAEKARQEHENAMQAARLREIELTSADRVAQSRREAMLTDALIGTRTDVEKSNLKRDASNQTLLERMDALIASHKTHHDAIAITVTATNEKLALLVSGFNELRQKVEAVLSNKGDLDALNVRINQIELDASSKVVAEAKKATGLQAAVIIPEQTLQVTVPGGVPTP